MFGHSTTTPRLDSTHSTDSSTDYVSSVPVPLLSAIAVAFWSYYVVLVLLDLHVVESKDLAQGFSVEALVKWGGAESQMLTVEQMANHNHDRRKAVPGTGTL